MRLNIKISIIIPAYNVEPYIEKCLNSCLDQDLQENEYEIIVINDGSTDNTLALVDSYTYAHANIKVYSKKNEGLGQARNDGIERASGQYIWFVDADDWIESNCLSEMYDLAISYDLDLLWFKLERINKKGELLKINELSRSNNYQVMTGSDFLDEVMSFSVYAVLFLIKKDYLNTYKLFFLSGIFYEDAEFIPRLVLNAKRVKFDPTVRYYYYQRHGSIVLSYNPKKIDDLIVVIASLNNILSTLRNSAGSKYFEIFISKITLNTFKLTSNPIYKSEQKKLLKMIKLLDNFNVYFFGGFLDRFQIFLYKISPKIYLLFCIIARKLHIN